MKKLIYFVISCALFGGHSQMLMGMDMEIDEGKENLPIHEVKEGKKRRFSRELELVTPPCKRGKFMREVQGAGDNAPAKRVIMQDGAKEVEKHAEGQAAPGERKKVGFAFKGLRKSEGGVLVRTRSRFDCVGFGEGREAESGGQERVVQRALRKPERDRRRRDAKLLSSLRSQLDRDLDEAASARCDLLLNGAEEAEEDLEGADDELAAILGRMALRQAGPAMVRSNIVSPVARRAGD